MHFVQSPRNTVIFFHNVDLLPFYLYLLALIANTTASFLKEIQ